MPEEPTERRAEVLAREAAQLAAQLALADAEKATALAVERAVKDADVAHTLQDHSAHLAQINGSQIAMAASLSRMDKSLDALVVADSAQASFRKEVREISGRRWSTRAAIFTGLGALAAYGSLVFLFLASR